MKATEYRGRQQTFTMGSHTFMGPESQLEALCNNAASALML